MRWNWRSATSVLRNIQYTLAERRFRERQRWTDRRMKCAAPASPPSCYPASRPRRVSGPCTAALAHIALTAGGGHTMLRVQVGQLASLLPQTGRRQRTGGGQFDDGLSSRAAWHYTACLAALPLVLIRKNDRVTTTSLPVVPCVVSSNLVGARFASIMDQVRRGVYRRATAARAHHACQCMCCLMVHGASSCSAWCMWPSGTGPQHPYWALSGRLSARCACALSRLAALPASSSWPWQLAAI